MPDPLSILERRVLGVLVEKALTSAAPEPLSLNAIVTGCNQKSNRDPVMNMEEPEVDSCLEGLKRKGLVFHVTGGRVERWRHNLYDAWQVGKPELAFLAELLLRGPQTLAEARTRASRMEPLDHAAAADVVKNLVERGFVVWLAPEGRRGAQLTHGFYSPDELDRLKSGQPATATSEVATSTATPQPDRFTRLESRVEEAIAEITKLRAEIDQVRSEMANLKSSLGGP